MNKDELIRKIKDVISDPTGAEPLYVIGPTGIGKSAVVKSTCDSLDVLYYTVYEPAIEELEGALSSVKGSKCLYEVQIIHDFKSLKKFDSYVNSVFAAGRNNNVAVVVTSIPQTEQSKVYSEHGTIVETITDEQIEALINEAEFNESEIINAIMIIGNESLDPATEYLSWEQKPYWRVATGKKEFMVKKSNGEWDYDPRIRKIGDYIDSVGGFGLMQKIYSKVVFGEYRGSEGGLERAWDGIGRWRS